MKKSIIVLGALTLSCLYNNAIADEPGTGHTTEVIPGDWDDDDPKLNFKFQDIPLAKYTGLKLHLTCGLPQAKILYTTDKTAKPTDSNAWTVYSAPLDLTEDCTVRFFARCEGYNDSDIQTFVFVYADHQAATPTVAPDMDRKNIVMVTDTPDATIRYTFDGSDPTEASTAYDGPFAIVANGTFKARSFASNLFPSAVAEYTVDFLKAEMPSAEFLNKHLVLSSTEPGNKLYYTFGDAPASDTNAWTLYSAPLTLTEDCTVRYMAKHNGYHDSEVGSFSFTYSAYQVAAPILTADADGTHVVMECATEGAAIRYTTDGSEPTLQSTLYSAPVEIVGNGTFRARAFANDLFDSNIVDFIVMHLAVPSPMAAFENKALVLTCSDPKAQIKYTLDADATPDNTAAWTLYNGPITLTENCTVRFFGCRDNFNNSDIQSFSFIYSNYRTADPTIERNAEGTHIVMESSTSGATIYYTTNGSEPTTKSAVYTGPIPIEGNFTYCAFAVADGLFDSKVNSYVVSNLSVPVPYASFSSKLLTLTCADTEAEIWYTIDDDIVAEETEDWQLYTGPIALTENCYIHFFTRLANFNDSDIETFVFLRANYMAETPLIERNEDGRSIIMTTATEGAEIRYTVDGSEPTKDSELYTDPIFITENCTFRARAYAEGLFESAVSEYTVSNMMMMTPYASFDNLLLTLSLWDEAGSIWYTLDAEAAPEDENAWTLYTEPLALDADCTVRYFARRVGFLDSQIASYDFVYSDWQTAAPELTEDTENQTVVITCPDEGAEIRYTTDGTEPTEYSELYTGPIEISGEMTICARAFSNGLFASEVSEITTSTTSGVETVSFEGLKVSKESGDVVVYSDKAISLPVYTIDGRLVKTVLVEPGRNVIDALDSNLYIIANTKIKL